MRFVVVLPAVLAASSAYGQEQFTNGDGTRTTGAVIECLAGAVAQPCGTTASPLEMDQGTPGGGAVPPSGGRGALGFLAGIYTQLGGGVTKSPAVSVSNLPALQTVTGTVTLDGVPGTGITAPTGGSGSLGWLSGAYSGLQSVYSKLATTLSISGTVTSLPGSGALIDNSTSSLGTSSTVLLMACGAGTSQQTGCTNGTGRSRLILLNQGTANACANYTSAAAFAPGSSSNCAAGSFLLPANGGGIDDSTGTISNQQVNAVCAASGCVLTVKSY